LLDDEQPAGIEDGVALELVGAADLGAVVSAVPRAEYGEEALQARLADPEWTAVRAMRHEKVLEYFAARTSIIPLRFATIYLSRERIEEMISERREELTSIIERLAGRDEWAVNVCRDTAALMEAIVAISPRLAEMAGRAEKTSPGQAFLLRKQIEALKIDEARAETKRVIEAIERRLAALSDGASRLRVMKDEMSDQGEVVAKLVFLVLRERFIEFQRTAEELARENRKGFRLEMTGPWPAYNFSSAVEPR
jgi:hypothetical protein